MHRRRMPRALLPMKGHEMVSDTEILDWIEAASDDAVCIVENWVENGGSFREACVAAMSFDQAD